MLGQIRFSGLRGGRMALTFAAYWLVAVVMLQAEVLAGPAEAAGSMELVCVPPIGLDIHLDGLPNKSTAVLHLWATPTRDLRTKKPLEVTASWCDLGNKCQDGKGTVLLKRIKLERKASGTYNIKMEDGRLEKGSFNVARRPQKKPFLCE